MAATQEEPTADRRSEERDGLLDGDEKAIDASQYDVEARAGITQNQNLKDKTQEKPVEYSISPNVKFAWLSAYFFFSLILTLYNKLVLGVVCFRPAPRRRRFGRGHLC